MFRRENRLQYNARPERADPLYAKKLQERIGGQWGEISAMTQYLFHGWNCRGPAKYRDMLLDIATEEIGHGEMLSTMVCRLLEVASMHRGSRADTPRFDLHLERLRAGAFVSALTPSESR